MAVSSRRPALVLTLFAVLLLGSTAAALAFEQELGPLAAAADERVLRLHDLPPGYQSEDDDGCGPLGVEGEPEALREFIIENRPEACAHSYERIFATPGPAPTAPLVGAAVVALADIPAAARLFDLLIDVVGERTGKEAAKELAPPPAIGEGARLYRTKELVNGRAYRPATIAIWRQGEFVAVLLAAGLTPAENDRIALDLAAVQQDRILSPSPHTEAEKSDVSVPLDDPWIRFPVFWLGETFRPGHRLPLAELTDASTIKHRGEGPPGRKLSLSYEGFTLGTWTRSGWKAFQRSVLGPLNRKWRCTSSTGVKLDSGYAEVFAAYGRDFRRCPQSAPNRYYAIAHLADVVVGVNLIQCTRCAGPGSGPYNSLRGMKAIVRGLEPRPKVAF